MISNITKIYFDNMLDLVLSNTNIYDNSRSEELRFIQRYTEQHITSYSVGSQKTSGVSSYECLHFAFARRSCSFTLMRTATEVG